MLIIHRDPSVSQADLFVAICHHMRTFLLGVAQRYGLLLVAAGCLLPFVVLSFRSHPALDDFAFAVATRRMGWLAFQKYEYLSWQGAYTTNALMSSLNPLVSGHLDYYWLSPVAVLTILVLGAWQLSWALLPRGYRSPGVAILLTLLLVQFPNPAEGLYWLNAAWAYLLSSVAALLWGALLVRISRHPMGWGDLAAMLLTAVLIGTNPVTGALLTGILLAVLLGSPASVRRRWLMLTIVAVFCLGFSLASPGNGHRLDAVGTAGAAPLTALSLLGALLRASVAAAYTVLNWLGSGLLLIPTLLLTPAMARLAIQPDLPLNRLTRNPWWLTVVAAGLVLAAFVPTYWAIQQPPPPRLRNVIYLLFVVGWLLTVYAWVAWWVRRNHPLPTLPTYVHGALLLWLPLTFLTDHNARLTHIGIGQGRNAVVQAYRDWLSGDAARYDDAQKARYQLLYSTPRNVDIVLPPLPVRPHTLFYYDISYNPALWGNQAYAQFFGKQTVRVQHPLE